MSFCGLGLMADLQRAVSARGCVCPTPIQARAPRALVPTPTGKLAARVGGGVYTAGAFLPLRFTAIFGRASIHPRTDALRRGAGVPGATAIVARGRPSSRCRTW